MGLDQPSEGGGLGDAHDGWYEREVSRGRRFHGAFAGGFSAGFHNTVGSAEGWTPATFSSSRSKRQKVADARPEDFGDAEDGLLGRSLAVGDAYKVGEEAPSEALNRRGARLVRLLRRQRKRRRYAAGLGGDDAPLVRAPEVPVLDGSKRCLGDTGGLERPRERSAVRDVYRVDDVLGKGKGASRRALMDSSGFALHDDEDDVYDAGGGASERYLLEDGPEEVALVASKPSKHGGLLAGTAHRRPDTLNGF
eukprot:CAMPEP_0119264900 /NCGR_PEP_ID=MMETSP1329-20130426/3856_1 /TAXON_ID=114041 /ORGANISM="Genus nov. species nov., Strain RCC1024" /LENGTH=250 /DNA_ID=CAMNT_0007264693 /DNA_START=184 /DNA_END=933 /DNA_ORIENTATION=-